MNRITRICTVSSALLTLLACGGDDLPADIGSDTGADLGSDADAIDDVEEDTDREDVGTDVPMFVDLTFEGLLFASELNGNGDSAVNPGETWEITGSLVRADAGDMADVTLRAATLSQRVTFPTPTLALSVGSDGTEFSFPIEIGGTESGTVPIDFTAFTSDNLSFAEETFVLDVERPAEPDFTFTEPNFVEIVGDGDATVEAEEQWSLTLTVRNVGDANAIGAMFDVTASSGTLLVSGVSGPGTVNAGDSGVISATIDAAASALEIAPTLTASATVGAGQWSEGIEVPYGVPDTLELVGIELEARTDANGDGLVQAGEQWAFVVGVRNSGAFMLEEIEWRLTVSEGEGVAPTFESGPPMLAGGASADVVFVFDAEAAVTPTVSVQFRASSSARSFHGPFLQEVTLY